VLASVIGSIYISHAETPNRTYGLISSVIVAIVWLYWSNLLFLAGAVLNAQIDDAKTHDTTGERAEQRAEAQP
jgi:membrane protein